MARRQRRHYPLIPNLAVKRRMREAAAGPARSQPSWAEFIASGWTWFRNFVLNAVGAAVFLGAAWLLYDAVTKPTIAIAPISVPEELEKKGYTSAVMADKLRVAISKLIMRASSEEIGIEVEGLSDIPEIVVPYAGLSVETLAAEIRRVAVLPNRWHVSGGVDAKGDLYEMNLKIANDVEVHTNGEPMAKKDIEQLIETSAQEILGTADPLWLASYYYSIDDVQASLNIAQEIARQYPESERAVSAHNIMGIIYRVKMHNLDAASKEFHEAVKVQPRDTWRRLAGAALDKKYAASHNNLGRVLREQGKPDDAVNEYKQALKLDPEYVAAHRNLGEVFQARGKPEQASEEHNRASELERRQAPHGNNLDKFLREQRKRDEAAEDRKAVSNASHGAGSRADLDARKEAQGHDEEPKRAAQRGEKR